MDIMDIDMHRPISSSVINSSPNRGMMTSASAMTDGTYVGEYDGSGVDPGVGSGEGSADGDGFVRWKKKGTRQVRRVDVDSDPNAGDKKVLPSPQLPR